MNYYCLIAGLPDLHAEDTKSFSSLLEIKEEMLLEVSPADAILVRLLFTPFDNSNFLKYLKDKDADLNPLGNIGSGEYQQLFAAYNEELSIVKKSPVPLYMQKYYLQTLEENFSLDGVTDEDYLSGKFYEFAMKSENIFLRKWFEFNLNINNLLTAIACRKHGLNYKQMVVGENDVAKSIRQTNARDFGLTGMLEDYELINRIADEGDLLEREKKIDALKWNWLEENTFFKYFSVEKLLVYLLKIQMLERWKLLSVEKGTQIFREMVGELKKGVSFEELK